MKKKKKKCNNFYTDTVCALSRLQLKVAQREESRGELSGLLLSVGAYELFKGRNESWKMRYLQKQVLCITIVENEKENIF